MRRSSLSSVALLLLAASCGEDPRRGGDGISPSPSISISSSSTEIPFGAPFPLEVVRTHADGLVPSPFDDLALAPLVLRLEERSVERTGGGTLERLRFRAHAFRSGVLTLPAVRFEAVPEAGGRARTALSTPFALRVLPALDPAAPGEMEPPPGPLPLPRSPWAAAAAAAALLGAAGLLAARARRRPAPPLPAAAASAAADTAAVARERARIALRSIREGTGAGEEERAADFVAAAAVVRTLLAEGCGLRTRERTTEEVLAAAGAGLAPRIAAVLGPADLVKFAAHRPSAAERALLLDAADALAAEGSAP